MNLRLISRMLGLMLMGLAATMSTSLIWAFVKGDPQSTVNAFLIASGTTFGSGLLAWYLGRDETGSIFRREALLLVGLSWLLLGVFGGLPYMLDGAFTNAIDAYFETISGFTTTGSTVLTEIEPLSAALHWWRGLTHWLGGMGIIVLFVAVFPQLGVGGKHLFKTEVPGPITEGLKPKIRETSWALWRIYTVLTLACAAVLYVVGPSAEDVAARGLSPKAVMDVHNALIHAFATLATGGFSTLNASVAGFDSVAVDVVITGFMFVAGVNFALYYQVLLGGWRKVIRDRELWVYTALVVGVTLIIAFNIWGTGAPGTAEAAKHASLPSSLRYSAFQVLGVMTTTGFGTDNFDLWPPLSKLLMVGLMFVGGMAGSTAGGMKVIRFIVIAKAIHKQIHKVFRPAAIQLVRLGGRTVPESIVNRIMVFFALGMITFILASLYMAALGLDVVTATTSVAATLFNIGPGLAKVGSVENFAFIPPSGKLVLSFCMILGRLEFYAVLVLLLPEFWRD